MTPDHSDPLAPLSQQVIEAFDKVNGGIHAGFRPAHAKGLLLSGEFTPAPEGAALTTAPHLHRPSTPVSVRFSDFAGVPAVADNGDNSSPRGIAIRFHLAEHVHTDIIGHSTNSFPTRTAEEFLGFLGAVYATAQSTEKPSPIEMFLGSHPAALAFVMTPKPIPVSFAQEQFFGVSAYKFHNASESRYGRYQIIPATGASYLTAEEAAGRSADFLFDELRERLAKEPVKMVIAVQMAEEGDVTDDATAVWPDERPVVELGTITLTGVVENNEAEQRHIIFDPIPRVEGIEASADPLLEPRASIYLMSGRRRRKAGAAQTA
ncbi:MAG: catalase [Acidobacteria bacterium]|nr:catalase [Acidobacteriota bacterium]